MISLIITGSADKREEYINNFCAKHNINKFDIINVIPEEGKKTQVLGIENVREVQEKIYQKALGNEKVIVFSGAQLTTEAQNALLKILEEPPASTTIIISVDKLNSVLPTIISRCKIIKLEKQKIEESYPNIQKIIESNIGDKLTYAQNLGKTKEEALDFLLASIELMRKELVKNHKLLEKFNETYVTISSTNVAPRFALEVLFLSL